MRQLTAAEGSFAKHKASPAPLKLLRQMAGTAPRQEPARGLEPHCRKPRGGRRPVGIERLPRVHFMRRGFSLSVPGRPEVRCDMLRRRAFADLVGPGGGAGRAGELQVPSCAGGEESGCSFPC